MFKAAQLPPAWRDWLHENLARGCRWADLRSAMLRAGLAPEQVDAALAAAPGTAAQAQQVGQAGPQAGWSRFARSGALLWAAGRRVRVSTRLDSPCVAVLADFMDAAECDELVRRARARLKRSAIVDPQTGREQVLPERSSEGTYFNRCEDDFIARIDARIAALMAWPLENGEGIQILRYGVGAQYRPHFDYFPPTDTGSAPHLARGGQRVATLVMYLNDVEAGGDTRFPQLGLSVQPHKGAALYFESCSPDGREDPRSLHAGDPVERGEKWIATKWMRQRPYV